jgi:hypothetical protein
MINLIYIGLLLLLFGVSPVAIYLLRSDFGYTFETAVFGSVFGIYCLAPFFLWQAFFMKTEPSRIFLEPMLPYVIGLMSVLTLVALSGVNLHDLEISRNALRPISRVELFLINLNLISSLLAVVYFFYRISWISVLMFFFSISTSTFIAYLEGRRAIVAIILGSFILCFFAFSRQSFLVKFFYGLTLLLALFFAFLFITAIRIGEAGFDISLLTKLALTRIFNPGWMINEAISHAHIRYESIILQNIWERLMYIFGFTESYVGVGNHFGTVFGFIDGDNSVVGINPGIVVEALLFNAALAPLIVSSICIWGSVVIRLFRRISKALSVLIVVLIVHGMQMEVGYTVGLLVRLSLLGFAAYGVLKFLPRRKVALPV